MPNLPSSSEIVRNSQEISNNDTYYWTYQFRLGKEVLSGYLKKHNSFPSGSNVCEIGSAEGGVAAALKEDGADYVLCTDIASSRLETGKRIKDLTGLDIDFKYHNILTDELPSEWAGRFNLALLRDVIEHLDDTYLALSKIKQLLKPVGKLLVTFPPYHSPYGGHQHTLVNFWGKFPYIHLLPDSIFHKMIADGRPPDVVEVKRLQNIRLTPLKFEKAAREAGYKISRVDFYLLRPVFKMKFGLPAVNMNALTFIPFIKNYLSLEACYILEA